MEPTRGLSDPHIASTAASPRKPVDVRHATESPRGSSHLCRVVAACPIGWFRLYPTGQRQRHRRVYRKGFIWR